MLGSVAAVHPESGRVERLALLDDLGDVVALAAFIAGAPENHAGVIAVAEHHPANALTVHLRKFGHIADIFCGVGFVAGLVDDEQTVLVSEIEVFVHRRIVRSTHGVEVEALEYLEILADDIFGHCVASHRMLHMRVDCAYLELLSVKIEHTVADFSLLEADTLGDLIHRAS